MSLHGSEPSGRRKEADVAKPIKHRGKWRICWTSTASGRARRAGAAPCRGSGDPEGPELRRRGRALEEAQGPAEARLEVEAGQKTLHNVQTLFVAVMRMACGRHRGPLGARSPLASAEVLDELAPLAAPTDRPAVRAPLRCDRRTRRARPSVPLCRPPSVRLRAGSSDDRAARGRRGSRAWRPR